jgi:hypothetical protein
MRFTHLMQLAKGLGAVCLGLALGLPSKTAFAGIAMGQSAVWGLVHGVAGNDWEPGSTVTITYANGTITHPMANASGIIWDPEPAATPVGTAFVATGRDADGNPETAKGAIAQIFMPPTNEVVTSLTVLPGSTVTFEGTTVALTGGFTAVETALDSNGNMSGNVLASRFSLGNSSIGLNITLTGNVPFTFNVTSAVLAAQSQSFMSASIPLPLTPLSVDFDINNQVFSATGTVGGTLTTFPGNQDLDTFVASLTSPSGPITMSINTFAPSVVTSVPEPSSFITFGLGAAALLTYEWRRRRQAVKWKRRDMGYRLRNRHQYLPG